MLLQDKSCIILFCLIIITQTCFDDAVLSDCDCNSTHDFGSIVYLLQLFDH